MTCSSTITIGGYPLIEMPHYYDVWQHFRTEDRIIRSRRKDQRNPYLQGPPTTQLEAQELEIDFAYSITADVLRGRLGRAGFTRMTLEQEFTMYCQAICRNSEPEFINLHPDEAEKARARADAFHAATLDDWLEALAETVRTGTNRLRRSDTNVLVPTNILVDIMTSPDLPASEDLCPEHCIDGFPCVSLNNMAVAMLEVTPGNALCEQEVSLFVHYQGDTTFDDLRFRKKASPPRPQHQ